MKNPDGVEFMVDAFGEVHLNYCGFKTVEELIEDHKGFNKLMHMLLPDNKPSVFQSMQSLGFMIGSLGNANKKEEIKYICEIAFMIGHCQYLDKMDKILENHTELEQFTYENYFDFYSRLYDEIEKMSDKASLLETLYKVVESDDELLGLRDVFLSSYKM